MRNGGQSVAEQLGVPSELLRRRLVGPRVRLPSVRALYEQRRRRFFGWHIPPRPLPAPAAPRVTLSSMFPGVTVKHKFSKGYHGIDTATFTQAKAKWKRAARTRRVIANSFRITSFFMFKRRSRGHREPAWLRRLCCYSYVVKLYIIGYNLFGWFP